MDSLRGNRGMENRFDVKVDSFGILLFSFNSNNIGNNTKINV